MKFYYHVSLAALMMCHVPAVWSCTKTLRWNQDPPFSYVDPASPDRVRGISVDTVRLVLSEMGCELKLLQMPWARALVSLETGNIDIISGAYNTEERREYAHFSGQPVYSPNILFIRAEDKDKWRFQSLEEIIPTTFRLGVQINVTYSQEFDALRKNPEFETHLHQNSSRHSLWRMLDLNRIDGVIADKFTGSIELKELALTHKIIPSFLVVSTAPSFFGFSKKTTQIEFVDKFDSIFARLVREGDIKKIEDTYLQIKH